MSFSFFVATRYLFSKKSSRARSESAPTVINVISGVAMAGIIVATMALIVTLSVFNGFRDLIATLFTSFDPQITVVPAVGKSAPADDPVLQTIRDLPQIDVATECVEDNALAVYNGHQAVVVVKGVDDSFAEQSHITDILYGDGVFMLHAANLQFGVPGIRLAQTLGTNARWDGFLHIYAPRREGQPDITNPTGGFVVDSLFSPGVVFCVGQPKYDKNYIVTHISFARSLFDLQGMLTSLDLRLKPGSDLKAVKEEIRSIAGDRYAVLDRYEQQAETFHIMQIEKLIAYIFLTFILVVACFNIIGSVSMLMVEKRADTETLRHLGANDRQICRIFLFQGWMISALGAVAGILLGLLLCWLQQTFGLVRLGGTSGAFIVDAYPVSVHPLDTLLVLVTVIAVGFAAVGYAVHGKS